MEVHGQRTRNDRALGGRRAAASRQTEKEGKPYLKPIPYKKVEKQQLKGNIYWNEPPKWDDGHMNSARWIVDRSNPKISLPRTYNLELAMADGSLKLEVFEDQESYLQIELIPIKSY